MTNPIFDYDDVSGELMHALILVASLSEPIKCELPMYVLSVVRKYGHKVKDFSAFVAYLHENNDFMFSNEFSVS